ncbi:MAG: hypothetical protein Kow0068_14790 [Marinilabiliales bacterium]
MKYIIILLIFLNAQLFCQKQGNIWYFGDHAGLDFNSGNPIPLMDGATYNDNYPHSEGTSVICDSTGNLLFYTNGQKIWNRNHQIMPNGDSLLGHLSSTQAALIVPQPGNSRYFYVFTTDAFYEDQLKYGFRYSIVDICLDNGYGDIISGQKNILLLDTVAEKLTAVRHANGSDYWIITHKFFSDAFYAYLLTSTGISDTTITHIGSIHTEYCPSSTFPTRSALGQLKASPDGSKIACVNGQTCYNISELFDFDNSTGVVSNVIQLKADTLAAGLYGVSFSPDNSKLYISSWIGNDRIYQFDLSSGIPTTIINSKTIIAEHAGGPWYQGMQLGPDGKIYVAVINQSYLSVINNPNQQGSACNFSELTVSLNGNTCSHGLPNFIDFFDYSNTITNCEVNLNENETFNIKIYPNPAFKEINIIINKTIKSNYSIKIYNINGVLVKEQTENSNKINIDVKNLENSLYIIKITGNDFICTKPFIKL